MKVSSSLSRCWVTVKTASLSHSSLFHSLTLLLLLAGLWGLVNNAGVSTFGEVEFTSLDNYKEVTDINLWGTVRVTKAFLPLIRRAKGICWVVWEGSWIFCHAAKKRS